MKTRRWPAAALTFAVALGFLAVPVRPSVSTTAAAVPEVPAAPPVPAPPVVSPEVAAATATAKQTGHRVEVASAGTASGQVYVNPDGHRTLVQHAGPIRVRRGSGWVPVDSRLRFAADGTVRPVAVSTPLVLSGGGDGKLVAFGNTSAQLRLGWAGTLPKPRLRGDTATYPEVLPGVDLQIRAESAGFAELLVVKTPVAAKNPALQELSFPLTTTGLHLSARPDGTTVAQDSRGKVVYTSAQALMSDAAGNERPVGLRTIPGKLLIKPDLSLLTAPGTRFPVTIDPSWSDAAGDLWTHINNRDAGTRDTSYWNFDREEGAKTGWAYDNSGNIYRSLYRLDLGDIGGAEVLSARFTIDLYYTPSSTSTYVDLYKVSPIDRAQKVTWNNTTWYQYLGGAQGAAYNAPAVSLGYQTAELKSLIQQLADQHAPNVSLGLRAPDENAEHRLEWKKFRGETAAITVEYNNVPLAPTKVNFSQPKTCGTATAPTVIGTTHPSFAAVATDPDGGTLRTQLQIQRASDDAVVYSDDSALTSSGAAFGWSELPDGQLPAGATYYYTARSDDQVHAPDHDYGPSSPRCYFTVDATPPGIPSITSTDFPDGSAKTLLRTTGFVTLHPAAGDTDIAEYDYGSQSSKTVQVVEAGPDGTATIPVTVWPDPLTGLPTAKLYVRAVDNAGNPSSTTGWDLVAKSAGAPPVQHVPGDVNGDGRTDISFTLDQGFGRTTVWTALAKSDGLATGTIAWDSGANGGFQLSKTRSVTGDFDGDGRTDVAMFRDEPGAIVGLYLLPSDGNRFKSPAAAWRSAPKAWTVGTVRTLAAEVTGDTKTDIVVQVNTGNGGWKVLVFPGGNLAAPQQWLQTAAASGDWSLSRPVLADVDGDGHADLISLKNQGGCRTTADMFKSTGTAFAAGVQWYDSGANGFCWDKANPVAGDVDGDGRQDVVAVYDDGDQQTSLKVMRSTGSALTLSQWWQDAARFDPLKATLSVGDYNADGKADAALIYALDGGGREVYLLSSTGTAFAAPVSGWRENRVGAGSGPKYDIETRTYELVSRLSGRCLEVAGASQTVPADIQLWDCYGGLHQRFRLVPIAGTEQYEIHAVHVNIAPKPADGVPRCFDVNNQSTADGEKVLLWHCADQANQQITLEYVEGSSYDTVFRLRFAHSGKCGGIAAGDTGNGVKLVQMPCGTGAEEQFVLRAALNSPQLDGRYKITSTLPTGLSLDIKDCTPSQGVRTWDYLAGSPCQQWQLKPLGDDIYQIIDPSTNTALQTSGCSRDQHATVIAFGVDESDCQRWRIEPAGDGWSIQQADTGLSLDVDGCSTDRGRTIDTWTYWNGPCQRWHIDQLP